MNCKVWYFWKCLKSPLELPCTATVGTFIEGTNYFNLKAHFTQLCYGKIQNATLKTPLFPSVYVLRVWVVPGDTRKWDNRSHRQSWVSMSIGNPGPPRSSAHNCWVISRQGLLTPGLPGPLVALLTLIPPPFPLICWRICLLSNSLSCVKVE